MILKVYLSLWLALFLAAAVVFLLGAFTPLAAVILGFIGFGLAFMGIISVLPIVAHEDHIHSGDEQAFPNVVERPARIVEIAGSFHEAWESRAWIHRPRYH